MQCEAGHARPCDAVAFSCAHYERAHLITCAELNEIKENGGKLFEADMDLMKLEDSGAVTFPDVDAWPVVASGGGEPQGPVSLSARLAGKVSLVTVSPPTKHSFMFSPQDREQTFHTPPVLPSPCPPGHSSAQHRHTHSYSSGS